MIFSFVQARMNSSRLYGKVMLPLCGKPVLEHIIERLKFSKYIDKIIVLTSTNKENNVIQELCNRLNISCFRGSEDNVLERFKGAIKEFGVKDDDTIIRITSDCPLCLPDMIDNMLNMYTDFDLITNCIERTYPDGLDIEIFKPSILYSPYFNEINFFEIEYNPEFLLNKHFKIYNTNLSHLRWTLDTQEDYEFIKGIYEKLYREGEIFLMGDILKCLEENK